MRLNPIEKTLMNNPIRAAFQRHVEARGLKHLGGRMTGGLALEMGCGRGIGARIIIEEFGADMVHAFDLDSHMVRLARRVVLEAEKPSVFWVGNAVSIPARDNSFDAVFDFGAIHHIVHWRDAICEVFRVLKPGGRFYVEEILRKYIVHPLFRRILTHPQEDRFDHGCFIEALQKSGFRIIDTDSFMQLYGWFIADKPDKLNDP